VAAEAVTEEVLVEGEILTEIPTVIEDMIEVVTVEVEELIIMTPEQLESTGHQYVQSTASLLKTCRPASVGRT